MPLYLHQLLEIFTDVNYVSIYNMVLIFVHSIKHAYISCICCRSHIYKILIPDKGGRIDTGLNICN